MKRLFLALIAAFTGVVTAYAVSENWNPVSDGWQVDGYFHTGFGATTTASFSVGVVFNVPNLAEFTADAASKRLLGVRNSSSSDNAGPSFELWTDGDVKGKIAPQMDGEGYTTKGDSDTTYGERGWADVNTLLQKGKNAVVITVEMLTEDSPLSTAYTLYINGTMVVTGWHFGINQDVYNYENLAALSANIYGSKVYYMNGIASDEDIQSLQPVYPDYITAETSEETIAKFDAWVTKYNVSDSEAGSAGNQDAYLLNVAPADAATEATNFKITAIAVNADGSVAVTVTDKNSKGDAYNGTIAIKGKAAIGDAEWTALDDKVHKFVKAFLELEPQKKDEGQ